MAYGGLGLAAYAYGLTFYDSSQLGHGFQSYEFSIRFANYRNLS